MSDTMNGRHGTSRLSLLTSVSIVALVSLTYSTEAALAGNPPLWVDLGWISDRVYDSQQLQLPLGSLIPLSSLPPSLTNSLSLKRSSDDYGKISFQPEGTNWVFSASVTYGRAHGTSKGAARQAPQGVIPTFVTYHTTIPTYARPYHRTQGQAVGAKSNYIAGSVAQPESHLIVDFQAGKDVGLGLLGSATVSAGVRFVNFHSSLALSNLQGAQDVHFSHFEHTHPTLAFFPSSIRIVPWYFNFYNNNWRSIQGAAHSSRTFNGIGPSVHWDASSPLFGQAQHGGEVSLDWGVNAAILFGKRKYSATHHTNAPYHCVGRYCGTKPTLSTAGSVTAVKNVAVPNLGGTIGLSYRLGNVKVSAGYRGDFFFHALSTSAQSSSTRGFHGPFAAVSVGIGD